MKPTVSATDLLYDASLVSPEVTASRQVWGRNELSLGLQTSHRKLVRAIAAAKLLREEILLRAEGVLQSAEAHYATGDINLAELLPVRRDWTRVRLDYLEDLYLAQRTGHVWRMQVSSDACSPLRHKGVRNHDVPMALASHLFSGAGAGELRATQCRRGVQPSWYRCPTPCDDCLPGRQSAGVGASQYRSRHCRPGSAQQDPPG